jgi:multidrug efflux pump subunit AcrA (membrane-fusion protein)
MGYSVVTAPFRGVLSRRHVDQGAFVSAGAPLAAIDEVQSGYELEAQADENLMGAVKPGMEVLGLVPAVSSRPFLTRLTTVVGRVDPATRTFKVRAGYGGEADTQAGATPQANATAANGAPAAASGGEQPRAGMFGKVCVPMTNAKKLLIPESAVRNRGELSAVLVVDDNRVLRLRLVKLGGAYLQATLGGRSFIVQAQDEALPAADASAGPANAPAGKTALPGLMREVLSGLAPGEVLVDGGPETLREGDQLAPAK